MARTMKWPPVPVDGRILFVEGVQASTVLVINTLGDLNQNPFNPRDLSLGDVAFRSAHGAQSRIQSTMDRLRSIVFVNSIEENGIDDDGSAVYEIVFTDRETRQKTEVSING